MLMANSFSYVYIQGDKQTPFYVKFEEEMLPRYGKNYSIISQLAPGPIKIQILFQQNIYPAQTFTINVPENGHRGFLLTQKGDAFSLYDIQQQFYLPSGNNLEDDKLPATPANMNLQAPQEPIKNEIVEQVDNTPVAEEPIAVNEPKKPVNGPEFIDIELNNDKNNNVSTGETVKNPAIPNSDCPKAVDFDLFEAIQKKATDKPDKSRLKYLLEKTDDNCFTSNQARILARTLKNDPERYTFLKKVYPRITDQSKFPALEALLTTQEWKSYFRLIIP
ncbi:hypothetical protein CAP35_08925 [Chitinophagaceae bacterium IBVUCB1]|nr:hypothetical protein CAP35_08925 [Chitinophagaceae bacterium IBVUCB1]